MEPRTIGIDRYVAPSVTALRHFWIFDVCAEEVKRAKHAGRRCALPTP